MITGVWCQPEPISGGNQCFCPVCDPDALSPFSCHSKRNCGSELVQKAYGKGINPMQPPKRKLLGDRVEGVLTAMGITKERVSKFLGRPCGCAERREKLNQLHRWAERKLAGLFKSDKRAMEDLEEILNQ